MTWWPWVALVLLAANHFTASESLGPEARIRVAAAGSTLRKFERRLSRAGSAIWPAISMPVGPAPTTTPAIHGEVVMGERGLLSAGGLVQRAAGWSALRAGLPTFGYPVAILATIRVGEKLLQRFGPKVPMLWGTAITAAGIHAAGAYKMASSLGSAFGVAMSYAVYTAGEHIPASLVPHIFWGRQDNVAMRFGGGLGLLSTSSCASSR